MSRRQVELSGYWKRNLKTLDDRRSDGRTFLYSSGDRGCGECCHGSRCDDPTHYAREGCPYCLGTGYPAPNPNPSPEPCGANGDDNINLKKQVAERGDENMNRSISTFAQMQEKYCRREGGTIVAVIDGAGQNCEIGLYVEGKDGEMMVDDLGWPADWEEWVSVKWLKAIPGLHVIRA